MLVILEGHFPWIEPLAVALDDPQRAELSDFWP
jgi:hypothetical protein